MTQLTEGDKAPDFKFVNRKGEEKKLDDYKGKKLVLYFYPKDNTPGCTAEACNLRDNYEELKNQGFEVIGVSPDNEKSHEKFADKYNLPFDLVPDTAKEMAEKYGVWGEKKMFGKVKKGIHRTTFIINEEGVIEKVIKKVKTKEHSEQIFKEYK